MYVRVGGCLCTSVCVGKRVWVGKFVWASNLIKIEHKSSLNLSFFRINSSEIFGQFSRKNPY